MQAMRRILIHPAEQLHSATGRYAGPLAGLGRARADSSASLGAPPEASEPAPAAASPLARDMALARLEAVLFLAREPLSSRKLSQYANLADGTQARTLVRRLNGLYDAAGRAFRIEQVAGGYQLVTRRKFASWLRRLAHVPGETRLSAPALETLAVIAYRQPVPRADIEAIRGVNCGEILRQLMDRDLVRIGGRSNELGRPYLYSTTRRFLQVFGLADLDELPRRDSLRSRPLPETPFVLPQDREETAEANSAAAEEGTSDWNDDQATYEWIDENSDNEISPLGEGEQGPARTK
jgi:segregation and condensation protein B